MDENRERLEREKTEELEDQILFPTGRKVRFMGVEIEVRPMPIKYAKEVNMRMKPARKGLRSLLKLGLKVDSQGKLDLSSLAAAGDHLDSLYDLDSKIADSLLEAAAALSKAYGYEWTIDQISENTSLPDLLHFLQVQMEVQSQEDFLLKPLQGVMALIEEISRTTSPKQPSMPPSAKDGG